MHRYFPSLPPISTLTPRQAAAYSALVSALVTSLIYLGSSSIRHRLRKRRIQSRISAQLTSSLSTKFNTDDDLLRPATTMDESIIAEQLARHYAFFGDAGMLAVRTARVVVVGIGGVGSHCAHMLARAGVGTLRVIDFDQVTLSSLNRHAVATFADVGSPKVSVMAKHLAQIVPYVTVDPVNSMYSEMLAAELLLFAGENSKPDFVVDCIDHLPSKVSLIAFCHREGIPLLSSMGSGAKADPSRVFMADISETSYDPLARAVRAQLRKTYGIENGVKVVYSSETSTPGLELIPPDPSESTNTMSEYAPLPTFRASILPVSGPVPAVFGCSLAAYVLNEIAGFCTHPLPARPTYQKKDYEKLIANLKKRVDTRVEISSDDALMVVEGWFALRSAVSLRVGKLVLVPWRPHLDVSISNLVPMTKDEAVHHWASFTSAEDPTAAEWLESTWPGVVGRVDSILHKMGHP